MQLENKAKFKIFSIHYNKPQYIYTQYRSFVRHFKVPFEFTVVNNAIDFNLKNHITQECSKLSITCLDSSNSVYSLNSNSHIHGLQVVSRNIKEGENILILDHDVFMIEDIPENYFEEWDLKYLIQKRGEVEYPWIGLFFLQNIKDISNINFNLGNINGEECDTGGYMYYYLQKHPELRMKYIEEVHQTHGELHACLDRVFIHLISGSDWNTQDYNLKKKLTEIKNLYNLEL